MAIPISKYLISVDDIIKFRPLAELDSERINPYILEAQSHDLRPVLGDAMYYDFMKNYDNVSASYDMYRDLLNGKEYTYNGYTVAYEGLTEMLAFHTLARFAPMNGVHLTRFGNMKKLKDDKSEPISPEEIRNIVSDLRSNAIRAAALVKKYLNYNVSTYPLYQTGLTVTDQNKLSVKFFDI